MKRLVGAIPWWRYAPPFEISYDIKGTKASCLVYITMRKSNILIELFGRFLIINWITSKEKDFGVN